MSKCARGARGIVVLAAVALLVCATRAHAEPNAQLDAKVQHAIAYAKTKLVASIAALPKSGNLGTAWPETARKEAPATWSTTGRTGWGAGYFPGQLWDVYKMTNDPATYRLAGGTPAEAAQWKTRATNWTTNLENAKTYSDPDIGHIIYNSFSNAYQITGGEQANYLAISKTAAGHFFDSYNSTVKGVDGDGVGGMFAVCVDEMVCVELPLWAATQQNDATSQAWYQKAINHVNTTMTYSVRPNGSIYHQVQYGSGSGIQSTPTGVNAGQGYSKESTWSRGQAWALYGFTMVYRYTQNDASVNPGNYLETARKVANYFIDHLPANNPSDTYNYRAGDYVPPWDFDAAMGTAAGPYDVARAGTHRYEERDTSAAAIAASALFELQLYVTDPAEKQKFNDAACNILNSLCTVYANPDAVEQGYLSENSAANYAGILEKAVYVHNDGRYNQSNIWGDYYFVEALMRYQTMSVPEPATVLLLATGAAGFGAWIRRRRATRK